MSRPKLMGVGDAARECEVTKQRFDYLATKYPDRLPADKTSSGRIFYREDVVRFKEWRKKYDKHKGKI